MFPFCTRDIERVAEKLRGPDLVFLSDPPSWREHRRDGQRAGASLLGVPRGSLPAQLRERVRDLGQAALHVGEVDQEPARVF